MQAGGHRFDPVHLHHVRDQRSGIRHQKIEKGRKVEGQGESAGRSTKKVEQKVPGRGRWLVFWSF